MVYVIQGQVKKGEVLADKEDTLFITETSRLDIRTEEQTALLLIETVM